MMQFSSFTFVYVNLMLISASLAVYGIHVYVTDANITATLNYCFQMSNAADPICVELPRWDTSDITTLRGLFMNQPTFNRPLNNWDVSKVTSLLRIFQDATSFNQPLDLWDTSKVIDMSRAFKRALSFNQELNTWDTGKVTSFDGMFHSAQAFNHDLNMWDVSDALSLRSMFQYATLFNGKVDTWVTSKVTSLKFTFANAGAFNQAVNSWNINQVTTLESTFQRAVSFDNSLNSWDTSRVTTLKNSFLGANSFNGRLNNWDVSKVESMEKTFLNAKMFNRPLNLWDITRVTSFYQMFSGADSFNQTLCWNVERNNITEAFGPNEDGKFDCTGNSGPLQEDTTSTFQISPTSSSSSSSSSSSPSSTSACTSRIITSGITVKTCSSTPMTNPNSSSVRVHVTDSTISALVRYCLAQTNQIHFVCDELPNWDTSEVTDMSYLFMGSLFNRQINSWDVSKVTSLKDTFHNAYIFNQPLESWDTYKVVNMERTFAGARNFSQPLNSWNISKVTTLHETFHNAFVFNHPLDQWDTSKVETLKMTLAGAETFNQILNSWDVSKVTTLEETFHNSKSFNKPLDLWDTSNIESLRVAFKGAIKFNQNLNSWNISKVTSLHEAFQHARTFNHPLDKWDTSKVESMIETFAAASSFNQALDNWDVSNARQMHRTFAHAEKFNHPLDSWNIRKVTTFNRMFEHASNFDQELCWNISDSAETHDMFTYSNGSLGCSVKSSRHHETSHEASIFDPLFTATTFLSTLLPEPPQSPLLSTLFSEPQSTGPPINTTTLVTESKLVVNESRLVTQRKPSVKPPADEVETSVTVVADSALVLQVVSIGSGSATVSSVTKTAATITSGFTGAGAGASNGISTGTAGPSVSTSPTAFRGSSPSSTSTSPWHTIAYGQSSFSYALLTNSSSGEQSNDENVHLLARIGLNLAWTAGYSPYLSRLFHFLFPEAYSAEPQASAYYDRFELLANYLETKSQFLFFYSVFVFVLLSGCALLAATLAYAIFQRNGKFASYQLRVGLLLYYPLALISHYHVSRHGHDLFASFVAYFVIPGFPLLCHLWIRIYRIRLNNYDQLIWTRLDPLIGRYHLSNRNFEIWYFLRKLLVALAICRFALPAAISLLLLFEIMFLGILALRQPYLLKFENRWVFILSCSRVLSLVIFSFPFVFPSLTPHASEFILISAACQLVTFVLIFGLSLTRLVLGGYLYLFGPIEPKTEESTLSHQFV